MKVIAITGLALLFSSSAFAQEVPAEPAKEEKQVCRTERATGSRTRTNRVCMTEAEWDRLRRETKQDIDSIQRNSGAVPRQQSGAGAPAGSG